MIELKHHQPRDLENGDKLCVPAAMKIYLSHFGDDRTVAEIAELLGADKHHGASLRDLEKLEAWGYKVRYGFCDLDYLAELLAAGHPVLCGVVLDLTSLGRGHQSHDVVLVGLSDEFAYLYDCNEKSGPTKAPLKQFLKRWYAHNRVFCVVEKGKPMSRYSFRGRDDEHSFILVEVTGEASTWGPEGVGGDYLEGVPDVPDNPPEYFGIWPADIAGQEAPPWSDADEWEPGGWQLEFDPGNTGSADRMVYFNGDVFAFISGGTGSGVWQRTPPNWTKTLAGAGSAPRGAVWNNRMFWGSPAADAGDIYSSPNGVNWAVDFDPGAGAYTCWSALGGYGMYLYAGMRSFQGVAGTTFYRRDTVGNWVATPPVLAAEINHGYDVIGYGGYVYHSATLLDVRRYFTAWENEPILNGLWSVFFTVHNGTLFAACGDGIDATWVFRLGSGGGWVKEFYSRPFSDRRAIGVGGNGRLYLPTSDGTDSRVYVRTGSRRWARHSTATGVRFRSVIADADGNLFAGTNDCEFYRYVPA